VSSPHWSLGGVAFDQFDEAWLCREFLVAHDRQPLNATEKKFLGRAADRIQGGYAKSPLPHKATSPAAISRSGHSPYISLLRVSISSGPQDSLLPPLCEMSLASHQNQHEREVEDAILTLAECCAEYVTGLIPSVLTRSL
jgi:hypothetical protein